MALTGRDHKIDNTGANGPQRDIDPRVSRALALTRLGMFWEQLARAFWPLATLAALIFACFALDLVSLIPAPVLPWLAGVAVILLVVFAIRGGLRFRRVGHADAVARLDRALPGRPLTALTDRAAIGGEGALWQAHLAQMRAASRAARAVPPNADLPRRDPFALRLAGIVALVMALIFGSLGDLGRGVSALAATATKPDVTAAAPSGPTWEGWAEPPAYTRRPTIYLNSWPADQVLELPKGSTLTFRLYGEGQVIDQDIGASVGKDPQSPGFRAEKTGAIAVADRRFEVTVLPDLPPSITAGNAPVRRADGRMIQDYEAKDDHGLSSAKARIDLDLEAIDRRYGLAIEPEPRNALELPLALPRSGDKRQVQGQLVQDLSRHPWANIPIKLTLEATDGIEQTGTSRPLTAMLPGKRFFQPVAAALIEIRRDLLWSRENAKRSAEILRAVTWQPEGFMDQQLYLQLRGAVQIMENGKLSDKARDELAEALWQAAIQLEDGGLSDALERMKQAQEKLSEAIRNGANKDEIQRLMDELKEATDAYKRMLAEQSEADPSERFTRNQPRQTITSDQIQEMMDEIQRLMNEGRMAEAQQLLEQFNRMMENLQMRQAEGQGDGEGQPGTGPMNRLADTLREQQQLSDEAFRDMQEQFGNGQMGQPSDKSGELAERQRELRESLEQQRGLLPEQGSEPSDRADQQLDDAGRAMEDAEQSLRDGDMSGAMQRQADAIQSMREGMQALSDMMGREQRTGQDNAPGEGQQGDEQAEGSEQQSPEGGSARRRAAPSTDPLGRTLQGDSGAGNRIELPGNMQDPAARARDLLDEIWRRTGQLDRPQDERDYLGRLLDRF